MNLLSLCDKSKRPGWKEMNHVQGTGTKMVFRIKGICAFSMILLLLSAHGLGAATKSFVREISYTAKDIDTDASAGLIAYEQAKRALYDDAALYLADHTEVKYFQLSREEVRALLAAIVRVEKVEENWNGKVFALRAGIQADILKTVKALDFLRKNKPLIERFVKIRKKMGEALLNIERFDKETRALKADPARVGRYHQAVRDLAAADGS